MNNRANDFVKNLVVAKVDLRWEKRILILKRAVKKVAFVLPIIVVGGGWWIAGAPDEYEQKVQRVAHLDDPWSRFATLSDGVDPNAWAIAWSSMPQSEREWARETNMALLEAVQRRDPRAIAFITGKTYGSYNSLEIFRRELNKTSATN